MNKKAKSLLLMSLVSLAVLGVLFLIYSIFVSAAPIVVPGIVSNGVDNFYYDGQTATFNVSVVWQDGPPSIGTLTVNCSALGDSGAKSATALTAPGVFMNYSANCTINYANIPVALNPQGQPFTPVLGTNITFTATNSTGSTNTTTLLGVIIAYNMTTPPAMPPGCQRFGSLTTNFANVPDFSSVNFIIQVEMNGSCLTGPGGGTSPWYGYQQVMMMNFSSLNMSSPSVGQRLAGLKDALQVNITPPHMHGQSRIYINSTAFAELNTNTTITINNIPFYYVPSITSNNATEQAAISSIQYVNNPPFNVTIQSINKNVLIPNVNLTFTVIGFTEYDPNDSVAPLVTMISPLANVSSSSVLVSVIVNGTGTDPSYVNIALNASLSYYFNASGNSTINCSGTGTDTLNCTMLANLPVGGPYRLNVSAWDYGSNYPGNYNNTVAAVAQTFWVNPTPPVVTIIYPSSDGQWLNITNPTVNYTVSAATPQACWYYNGTGNTTITCGANITQTWAQGNRTIIIYANESTGLSGISSATRNFMIDNVAPRIDLNSPVNATWISAASFVPNFNFSDANGAGYCKEYYGIYLQSFGAVTNGSGTLLSGGAIPTPYVNNGTFTWYIWCNDTAGNVNISEVRTLYSDTAAPNATLLTPGNGTYLNASQAASQNYTVNVTDNLGLKNATLNIYNSTGSLVNQTNTTFAQGVTQSLVGTVVNLIDGVYRWFYSLFDFAGNNYVTGNNTVTIDTLNPGIDFGTGTDGPGGYASKSNLTINMTYSDANTMTVIIRIYNSSGFFDASTAANAATGSWTWARLSCPDGIYFFNGTVTDGAGNFNKTATRNVTLDATAPAVTVNSPATTVKNTTVFFNITAIDTTTTATNCWVTLDNGVTNKTMTKIVNDFNYTNSSIAAGTYTAKFYCNDTLGNINNSVTKAFTADTTLPSISLTSPTNGTTVSSTSGSVTFTFSATDTIQSGLDCNLYVDKVPDMANFTVSSIDLSSTSASTTVTGISSGLHNWTVECFDSVGNYNTSATWFFTVDTSTTTTSSAGGGGTYSTASQIAEGITKSFYVGEALTFTAAGGTHSFLLISTSNDLKTVTIQLASVPQKATMAVGEEKKFDLNADSYYDVYVKINNITRMKADITIKTINESMTAAPIVVAPAQNVTAPTTVAEKVEQKVAQVTEAAKGGKGAWIFWIVTVVVLVLIVWFVAASMRKPSKKHH